MSDTRGPGQRGVMLVISSPSGAGKTTLCHRLMDEHAAIRFSVSYTTRPPRVGERDGVDYRFVDDTTFDRMVEQHAFAEWAHVHDHRYGTTRATVEGHIDRGEDLLFDIDWQGALQLRDAYPLDTILVFVLPPSMEELERRLRGRGTDAPEVVDGRLARARGEMEQFIAYRYLLINDDIDRAYDDLRAIYRAARLERPRSDALARRALADGHR